MRAFGIFSIITAISAALSVYAAPISTSDFGVADLNPVISNVGSPVADAVAKRGAVSVDEAYDVVRRTDVRSLPTILIDVTAQIKAVVDTKLDAALKGEVDVNVVVGILAEVKGILVTALADVKLLVGLALDVVLNLNGQVLAVADVAVYVVALIRLVVGIIVQVKAVISVAVVIQICIDISVALSAFLGVVFSLVGGLLAVVVSLIADVIVTIQANINIFAALVAVLGL